MTCRVEIVPDPAGLRQEWTDLCDRCVDKTVFLRPSFLLTQGDICAGTWAADYVCVRDDGRLVGLLPLYRRRTMGCRILGFPVSGSTPPFSLIAEAGKEVEVAEAIAAHLKSRRDWDVLRLHKICLDHAPANALADALERHMPLVRKEAETTYLVDTASGSFEEYMATRSRQFRKTLRKAEKQYDGLGELRDLDCPGDLSLDQAMKMVEQVLERSWKGGEDSAGVVRHLKRYAEPALEDGILHLSVATLDGQPLGYQLWFVHAQKAYGFHLAYDVSLPKLSPGHMQLGRAINIAFDTEMQELDLCGSTDYLQKWATGTRTFTELRLVRSGLRSQLIGQAYLRSRDRRHEKARAEVEQVKEDRKQQIRASEDSKE